MDILQPPFLTATSAHEARRRPQSHGWLPHVPPSTAEPSPPSRADLDGRCAALAARHAHAATPFPAALTRAPLLTPCPPRGPREAPTSLPVTPLISDMDSPPPCVRVRRLLPRLLNCGRGRTGCEGKARGGNTAPQRHTFVR
jgi:hypothetical protein